MGGLKVWAEAAASVSVSRSSQTAVERVGRSIVGESIIARLQRSQALRIYVFPCALMVPELPSGGEVRRDLYLMAVDLAFLGLVAMEFALPHKNRGLARDRTRCYNETNVVP